MQMNLKPGEHTVITTACTELDAVVVSVNRYEYGKTAGWEVVYDIPGYGITQPYWYDDHTSFADVRRTRSGIPVEYVYKRGSDFKWDYYGDETEMIKKIANSFVARYEEFRRSGRGLYICSQTKGSGKTLLACCLANEVMERYNAVVKFIQVLDYIDLIKKKGEGVSEAAEEQKRSLKECSLLILDDMGVQTERQEWINNALFSLIDERYRNILPTIYTSNLPMERASGDDRIQSRIYGTSIPILLPEVSIRDRLADQYRNDFLREVLSK